MNEESTNAGSPSRPRAANAGALGPQGATRAGATEMRKASSDILVTWVSIGHAAEPLLTVLANPKSDLYGKITDLYLCHRWPGEEDEQRALEKTRERLSRLPDELRPEVHLCPWKFKGPPTEHGKILEFAKRVLREVHDAHPNARLNIHLSPGTKAMHAVWFMLGAGAFVPRIRLLQTSEERFRKDDEKPYTVVNAKDQTWSRLIHEAPRPDPSEEDDEVLWDPSRVESPSAKRVLAQVERWAPLPVPLLLLGERGTGKTTLAHVIRALSPYKRGDSKVWPVVVCGQFRANPDLARSELFGHSRGAFTGADKDRAGLLEQSNGDTLFLDEIADLDRQTQRLLMAAVEGRGFQRLGDSETRQARFRLLAATNRRLEDIRDRDLDADFLDRVATLVLRLPPLRERRPDLPALWGASLRRIGRQIQTLVEGDEPTAFADGLSALANDRKVLDVLGEHRLPGNLRDLHRAAWRAAAALHAGDERSAVAREAIAGLDGDDEVQTSVALASMLPIDLDAHLAHEERRLLETALTQAEGSKVRAAELVGLPRKTFEYRLARSSQRGTNSP